MKHTVVKATEIEENGREACPAFELTVRCDSRGDLIVAVRSERRYEEQRKEIVRKDRSFNRCVMRYRKRVRRGNRLGGKL